MRKVETCAEHPSNREDKFYFRAMARIREQLSHLIHRDASMLQYELILCHRHCLHQHHYVNVQDTARCHVGALLSTDAKSERLSDFAHPYNWNDILAIFRKLYPEREFMDDIPDLERDLSKVANERAEEMVKRLEGQSGPAFRSRLRML